MYLTRAIIGYSAATKQPMEGLGNSLSDNLREILSGKAFSENDLTF